LANGSLEQSQSVEKSIVVEAAKGQKTIDASSERSRQLDAEIEQLQAELQGLEVYRDHLQAMVNNQALELASFDEQLNQIEGTRQSIVPLMYSMLEGLEQHIAEDRPIRIEARQSRLASLNAMMTQADISDAEKYRRILEAYQIELDYGTKLGRYAGMASIDGETLDVEQLYVGRVALVARSYDRQHYWAWHATQKAWLEMNAKAGLEIDKAFDIANKQAAPGLLQMPVSLVNESVNASTIEQEAK
jgi:hypothetical protein